MKFAICNEIYQNWRLEEVFAHAARLGYAGVEVAPFTLADSVNEIPSAERQRLRDAAARHGIEVVGLHWLLVKPEGLHLNHPDAAIRRRTAAYFCDLVDCCADLGGRVMVVGSPKQRSLLPGVSREQAWEWTAATFRDAVKRAEDRGVTICLEPLAPAETNFINTAAEAIEFVRPFGSERFKIILDVKAMCAESKPIPQIIRESWPHFAHFHANDRNLKGPGFGDVDFGPIVTALREVGYDGWVSVEVFRFEEGPEVIAGRSIGYLRRVFENGGRPDVAHS
ncbi:MAG: sugar phosphate isomerase/epimerase family protein [Verrucomicrobiales bacterium]|nr:sugar phosphate isomerase/epimerase family protein [Verrucomicrobiales bacterium]